LGYPFCRGRIFENIEKDTGQYDDIVPVHWASGACMAVRSEAYHLYGGFDERFFAHMEEIDLCWKWRNQGFKIYYHGGISIKHLGGGTLAKSNPQKTYLNFRNSLMMLHNNLSLGKLIPVYGSRVLLDAVAALVFAIQGKGQHSLSVAKAHAGFFKLKSRNKKGGLAPKLSNQKNVVKVKSIVWEYHIKGHKKFSEL
jgi:GT2 family glycosyltransferase